MKKKQLLIKIRTKKLGLLIYNARQIADRSIRSCSEALGIPQNTFKSFESGLSAPSLPELELLAEYLNIAINHFDAGNILNPKDKESLLQEVETRKSERDLYISQQLRSFREQVGFTINELSEESGVEPERIMSCENEQMALSLPELENLASALEIKLESFIQINLSAFSTMNQPEDIQTFLNLPDEIREFIVKPVNLPYLELAAKLSQLPAEKLRNIAESLLEITF